MCASKSWENYFVYDSFLYSEIPNTTHKQLLPLQYHKISDNLWHILFSRDKINTRQNLSVQIPGRQIRAISRIKIS